MKAPWLRRISIAASILIYALLVHHSNATHAPGLGAALAAAPLLIGVVLLARRWAHPALGVGVTLLLCGAGLGLFWSQIERNYSRLYLLQQCGLYGMLAVGFGRSLLAAQEPLCTQWARRMRGTLPDVVARYTRAVTLAWTVFFVLIGVIGVALYVWAPLWLWSVYANFLTLPLVLLMFLSEYALRHRLMPSLRRISLLETMRAYIVFSRSGTAPRT